MDSNVSLYNTLKYHFEFLFVDECRVVLIAMLVISC